MKTYTCFVVATWLLSACWRGPEVGERHDDPVSADGGRALGFQQIVTEVLVPSCATSYCHEPDPPPAAPMSLEADKAYATMVGVPASQDSSLLRVEPSEPSKSYLIIKLRAQSALEHHTTRMPLNKPELDEATIAAIEEWILRGAPND